MARVATNKRKSEENAKPAKNAKKTIGAVVEKKDITEGEATNEDTKDLFDKTVGIDLKTDICQFCRQGHDFGLLLQMKSVNPEEVADSEIAPAFANTRNNVLDVEAVWASRFSLMGKKRQFVHYHCALNSPRCWMTKEGVWYNIGKEIYRGRSLSCKLCDRRGATLGCVETRCKKIVYHIPCAIELGFYRTRYRSHYRCPSHDNENTKKGKNKKIARPITRLEDLSMGQERIPIPVITLSRGVWSANTSDKNTSSSSSTSSSSAVVTTNNKADNGLIFPDFRYYSTPVDSDEVVQNLRCLATTDCCSCAPGMCFDVNDCACLQKTGKNYALNGTLLPGVMNKIVECNFRCQCNSRRCSNRVVQRGSTVPMEVFEIVTVEQNEQGEKDGEISYGVRCTEDIQSGAFVCTLSGQMVLGATLPRSIAARDQVEDTTSVLEYFRTQHNEVGKRREMKAIPVAAWEEQEGEKGNETVVEWAKRKVEEEVQKENENRVSPAVSQAAVDAFLAGEICIDARYFGNVGSFIRRRQAGSVKMLTKRHVHNNANDDKFPRLALFATKFIKAGTELVI